jgi:hypothetical protein
VVPFDGQCLTTARAVNLAIMADDCETNIRIELERANELRDIDVNEARLLRSIDAEAHVAKTAAMQRRIDRSNYWLKHPALWFAAGVVVTVASVLLARETVIEVRQ